MKWEKCLFVVSVIIVFTARILHSAESLAHNSPLAFIDTSFENASPLYWEYENESTIQIYLVYDLERDSPNRANGHWHFQLQGQPGTKLTLILNNLMNVWNGRPGIPISDRSICKTSVDGIHWETIETEIVNEEQLKFGVELTADTLYVAHVEPYRISDLHRLMDEIRNNPLVKIMPIGHTVEGRELEIIRIGTDDAPNRVFLRARAHAWEPGGNWVVQGLIHSLLGNDPENENYLKRYAVYIMPIANKDSVARGRTRFNSLGKDLNRNWDVPADPKLAPENHALEQWFESMNQQGKPIGLAIDLHNDQSGRIHISRPNIDLEAYLKKMERYEQLMRQYTWFTEGSTGGEFRNPGTIGEGLLERYGIPALVQELNCNWIEGLKQPASGKNWERLGNQYRQVFYHFFDEE